MRIRAPVIRTTRQWAAIRAESRARSDSKAGVLSWASRSSNSTISRLRFQTQSTSKPWIVAFSSGIGCFAEALHGFAQLVRASLSGAFVDCFGYEGGCRQPAVDRLADCSLELSIWDARREIEEGAQWLGDSEAFAGHRLFRIELIAADDDGCVAAAIRAHGDVDFLLP